MDRRKFLNVTLGTLALAVLPANLKAEDYRKLKPLVWSAHTIDDAVKAMFGTTEMKMEGVTLKTDKVAANGGAIPVKFGTEIPAKTIAVFQDSNPEAAVIVYDVTPYEITDYSIKIKMAKSGSVTVVVLGQDGKLYAANNKIEVALGGCEG